MSEQYRTDNSLLLYQCFKYTGILFYTPYFRRFRRESVSGKINIVYFTIFNGNLFYTCQCRSTASPPVHQDYGPSFAVNRIVYATTVDSYVLVHVRVYLPTTHVAHHLHGIGLHCRSSLHHLTCIVKLFKQPVHLLNRGT